MYVLSPAGKRTNEYVKLNEKAPRSKLYEITGTNGSGDDTKLELQLLDTGEKVSVTEKQPYERVEGHIADLWYQPDLKAYTKKHVDDTFTLDGEPYKVVAITNDAVTVQQMSTTEKTTINWNGKPGAGRRP
jgi:Lhr-like helicase